MKNINELSGIIKGINFDGVVNQKEANRLKLWVNSNRELACTSEQKNIIKTIDDILEDNIVTDEERYILEKCVKEYLSKNVDVNSRLYELNGIIDGIICDKVLNDLEIYNLKKWLDQNGNFVESFSSSRKLVNVIRNILEDGIITEGEREGLLNFLSGEIEKTQFETKLNTLCSFVKNKKIIGLELIKNLDDLNAIQEIHNRAEMSLIKTFNNSYSCLKFYNPEVIMISLILIAMLTYDGDYYRHVQETYPNLYKEFNSNKIESAIRSLIVHYRPSEGAGSTGRIINYILVNAVVPSHFLPNFFEFIFDIYGLNFEYTMPENPREDFKFVYENLKNKMNLNTDHLEINVTNKTYKLIKTTKDLIANSNDLREIIDLSINILNLIDKKYWNQDFKVYNPYLLEGFEAWSSRHSEKIKENQSRKKKDLISRWEPKFIFSNNKIYLLPPVHKIDDTYSFQDIYIEILNDDKVIYKNDFPKIKSIIGGYKVNQDPILIDNPLGTLTYRVKAKDKIIYNSKQSLFRNFIIFDKEGSELKNNTEYKGNVYICYESENKDLEPFYEGRYKLASKNVTYSEPIVVEDEVFNFTKLLKPGVFGDEVPEYLIRNKNSMTEYKVYKRINFLVFEVNEENFDYEVEINGRYHKLIDLSVNVYPRAGIYRYVVDLNIKDKGIYDICVKKDNKNIFSVNAVCDPDIEVVNEKIDERHYEIVLESSFLKDTLKTYIDVTNFSDDEFSFNWKNNEFYHVIPFSFEIFKVDDSPWKLNSENVWIEDIKEDSKIYLKGLDVEKFMIYSSTGKLLNEEVNLKKKGNCIESSIGFLRTYKETYDYVLLVFIVDGKADKGLYCFNKCVMQSKTKVNFDWLNECIVIEPYFDGLGNVYYELTNAEDEVLEKSGYLINGSINVIEHVEYDSAYKVNFYEKGKGFLKRNRLLKSFTNSFTLNSIDQLYFPLCTAFVSDYVDNEFIEFETELKNVYIKLTNKLSDKVYEAKLYCSLFRGYHSYQRINPVEVEITGDAVNGKVEVEITCDGDGLYIDMDRKVIKDTTFDKSALDILSYTMSLSGVEKI